MFGILSAIGELASGLLGCFAILKAIQVLRAASASPQVALAWKRCALVVAWCALAGMSLSLTIVLGRHGFSIVLSIFLLLATLIFVSGAMAARLTRRSKPVASEPAGQSGQQVTIRRVVAGRIRGFDSGTPIFLAPEDEQALSGARGYVRLLAAGRSGVFPTDVSAPVLGFWNDEGTSILVYHDDVVEITSGGTQ